MPESPSRNGTAACGTCGALLPSGRARLWCSDACRQAAHRRRHPSEASPAQSTVYECDSCGERFIGTQRCQECNLFARRLGAGGHCPHCDEPVAVAELVEVRH